MIRMNKFSAYSKKNKTLQTEPVVPPSQQNTQPVEEKQEEQKDKKKPAKKPRFRVKYNPKA